MLLTSTEARRHGFKLLEARALGLLNTLDVGLGVTGSVWVNGIALLQQYWSNPYMAPNRLHQACFDLSAVARQAGSTNLAAVLAADYVDAARRIPNRLMEALGALQQVALLEENEEFEEASRCLRSASALIRSLEPGDARNLYEAEANVALARSQARTRPREALRTLASVDAGKIQSRSLARRYRQVVGHAQLLAGQVAEARTTLQVLRADMLRDIPHRRRLDWAAVLDSPYRDLVEVERSTAGPEAAFRVWQEYHAATFGLNPRGEVTPAPGVALVSLHVGRTSVVGWIRDSAGLQSFSTTAPPAELRRDCLRFSFDCAGSDASPELLHVAGRRLFVQLFGDVAARLAASRRWIIQADQWLGAVPFEALVMPDGRFAVENRTLLYARALVAGSAVPPLRRVLAVAAPTSIGHDGRRLPVLESAEREAAEIAARWGGAALSSSADIADLAHLLPDVDLFHFAGHGWANGGAGGLQLGGRRVFTSSDLDVVSLPRRPLTVLSACLTAADAARGPVAPDSLVNAFLLAGATAVIATRWRVDGEASRLFMTVLYDGLMAGLSPADALSEAQRRLVRSTEYAHPRHWAAFSHFAAGIVPALTSLPAKQP